MKTITILAVIAILAGTTTILTMTGFSIISSALAQDNATTAGNMTAGNMTAGNMTAGNMTAGNMTDVVGSISEKGR